MYERDLDSPTRPRDVAPPRKEQDKLREAESGGHHFPIPPVREEQRDNAHPRLLISKFSVFPKGRKKRLR